VTQRSSFSLGLPGWGQGMVAALSPASQLDGLALELSRHGRLVPKLAASDAKLFGFQESTNKPLPRFVKIWSTFDYGHRSQISAGRYLQEKTPKTRVRFAAIICSDGCQLHITGIYAFRHLL